MEQLITPSRAFAPKEKGLNFSGHSASEEYYPPPSEPRAFRAYFEEEGFIVVRNAVPPDLCEAAKQAFLDEVLPDKSNLFLRHASSAYERHVYTESGFMKYPIMNIQDISDKRYSRFRNFGLQLLTQDVIQKSMAALFGEPGQLIHSMYFDGNQATWAHRDGHYIDSQQTGGMVGVWVAAEDIHPDAGRFYVMPRSHRIAVPGEQNDPNRDAYKAAMAEFVRNGPLECVSPVLKQGDMLLWSSLTVHGSLPTLAPQHSRRSFTAHYVPASHGFRWNGGGVARKAASLTVNGVPVLSHKREDFAGRLKDVLVTHFPRLYQLTRGLRMRASAAAR